MPRAIGTEDELDNSYTQEHDDSTTRRLRRAAWQEHRSFLSLNVPNAVRVPRGATVPIVDNGQPLVSDTFVVEFNIVIST